MQSAHLSKIILFSLATLLLSISHLVGQEESTSKKMIIISSGDHKDFQIEDIDGQKTYYIDGKEVEEATFMQETKKHDLDFNEDHTGDNHTQKKIKMLFSEEDDMLSIDSLLTTLSLELKDLEGFGFDSLLAFENMDIHIKKLGEEFGENFNFQELGLQELLDNEALRNMPHILEYDYDIDHDRSYLSLSDQMQKELNEDGFLVKGQENEVELTGKHLKINGDKQAKNIWNKYKDIYEQNTGIKMTKDTKIKLKLEGKNPAEDQEIEKEIIIKKKSNRI